VDGDTFWLHRVKYRIADIDPPEVVLPRCRAELELVNRATGRLAQLINSGGSSCGELEATDTVAHSPSSRAMAVPSARSLCAKGFRTDGAVGSGYGVGKPHSYA